MIQNSLRSIPRPPSAVIFDLDGTLVDSAADLRASVNWALDAHRLPTVSATDFPLMVGDGAQKLIERAVGALHTDSDLIDSVLEAFRSHYETHCLDATQLFPGATELLAHLHATRTPLAIVSNKPARFTQMICDALALSRYSNVILGGDSLPRKKPDPLPLLTALRRLSAPVGQAVMVGDGEADMQAARAAGVFAIGVTYGFRDRRSLDAQHPDMLVDALPELLALL